jgi:hypothetical protein
MLVMAVMPATALDLDKGLVAYYSFDNVQGNTLKDDSGNGHDGIIYGNPKIVDGIKGKALEFDGVDDFVEISNHDDLNPPEITLSMWINCYGLPPCKYASHNHHIIINKECQYEVAIMGEPHGAVKYVKDIGFAFNPHWYWYGADYPIELNKWYHIVVVYKNPYAYVYVNGVKVKQQKIGSGGYISPKDSTLRIGARGGCSDDNYKPCAFFKGVIDELRIYNRALSDEEIKALYEQTLNPTPKPKLKLTIDCDSTLKQGEVRNGKLTVENIGNADAKEVKVTITSPSLGINVQKEYDIIPSEEARTIAFKITANEAGKFKITAIAEYWDDEGNKYIETTEKVIEIEPIPTVTTPPMPTPTATAIPTVSIPVMGKIHIRSEPTEADVYIDGEYKGKTPIKVDVKDGLHYVVIKREGYEDYAKDVYVGAGKEVLLEVVLKPKQTPTALPTVTTKPKLVITYLGVNPEEVYQGDTVEIRADIVNVGCSEGTFKINLMVDGKIVDYQEVFLKPNEHKTFVFRITADKLGTHIVKLGYKESVFPNEATFYVKPKPTPTTTKRIPAFEIYLAVSAISIIAILRKYK